MKKKITHIALLSATVALAGCNDWLDMNPTDKVSEKIVWSDPTYVTQYVNGFYPYISRYGSFETGDSQVGLTEGLTETLKFGSATPVRTSDSPTSSPSPRAAWRLLPQPSTSGHGTTPTRVSAASMSSSTD